MGKRFARFISDYWRQAFVPGGMLGLTLLGFVEVDPPTRQGYAIGLALLAIVGFILQAVEKDRFSDLRSRNEALEEIVGFYPLQMKALLHGVGRDLAFAEFSQRISLYTLDEINGDLKVTMIGRYSANRNYDAAGRTLYPRNQGVIGQALSHGECLIQCLPDPNTELDVYCNRMLEAWDIPLEVSREFKMKSRSYFAYALKDTAEMDVIAIIVFESTEPYLAQHGKIKEGMEGSRGRDLRTILERLRRWAPALSEARKEGF